MCIVSSDTCGTLKCFGAYGFSEAWSTQLSSRDPVNKTAATSLAALPQQPRVACGMYGLVHVVDTCNGATLQTLHFPEWVNVCAAASMPASSSFCPSSTSSPGSGSDDVVLVAAGESNSLHVWLACGGGEAKSMAVSSSATKASGQKRAGAGAKAEGTRAPGASKGGNEKGGHGKGGNTHANGPVFGEAVSFLGSLGVAPRVETWRRGRVYIVYMSMCMSVCDMSDA